MKVMRDPSQSLMIDGCKVNITKKVCASSAAAEAEAAAALMPWIDDLRIDRFDVRACMDIVPSGTVWSP